MSASLELVVDLGKFRPHPFRDGLALAPEPSSPRQPTDVGEAEEIERLGFPDAPSPPVPGGVPPELDQPGLVRMQLQTELREPLAEIGEKPLRVLLILEPYAIYAGSLAANPQQGVIIVMRLDYDPCAASAQGTKITYYPTPSQQGAVTLTQLNGVTLKFTTATGAKRTV